MNELEKIREDIAKEINSVESLRIHNRPLNKEDLENISNQQQIRLKHRKGFDILVRRDFTIEKICNFPVLMYSLEEFMVADELLGEHGVRYNAEDMAEYINGLLGYEI